MARKRYNGLTATLGAALAAGDTTVTFAAPLTHAAGSVPTIAGSDYIPLAILDSTTNAVLEIVHLTAYTTGATTGTIARAQESTTAADRTSGSTVTNGPTAADLDGLATSSGRLLAVAQYNPASATTLATTSATAADADAVNLAVTFTAPSSGNVVVRFGSTMTQTTASKAAYWHVREGSTTLISRWIYFWTTGASSDLSASAAFLITGLTPGTSHTYKWAHSTDSGGTSRIYCGGTIGPAIIEVVAAP